MIKICKFLFFILTIPAILSADVTWVGTNSVDFLDLTNWSYEGTPAGQWFVVNGNPYDPAYNHAGQTTSVEQMSINAGGKLTIRAGEIKTTTTSYYTYVNGECYLQGGNLNCKSNVYVGSGSGTGKVEITSGVFTCGSVLTLGFRSGADGTLNVYGGSVYMKGLRVAYSGGTGRIGIKNSGTIYYSGNAVDTFNGLISSGLLTTESGWKVSVVYNGTYTVITTAQVAYATGPSPATGGTSSPYNTILSWKPGKNALQTEIYFGTSSTAVTQAVRLTGDLDGSGVVDLVDFASLASQWLNIGGSYPCPDLNHSGKVDITDIQLLSQNWTCQADTTYLAATDQTSVNCDILEPGTTYYWRADSVTCDTVTPGDIWNFTTTLPVYSDLPAFPGAEGYGAYAKGGRGGDVYTVTNLNSSGAGSFRYGVENAPASGRTIVFAVSGYIPINYNSDTGNQTVRIVQNNVTIAGQTAPGDGIGLKDGRILMTGNNTIIRHLRIRHGKYGGAGDCLNLESTAHTSIIDHISLMFSTDENISFFNSSLDNFTMQYSTSSWGMERHNAGGLWDMVHGSCHHSLWAHHRTRNPKARPYGLLEWVNNVTCHWRSEGFIMGDSESNVDWYANVIGCYFLSIPDYEFGLKYKALAKGRIASDGKPNFHLYLSNCLHDSDGNGLLNGTDKGYDIVDGLPYPDAGSVSGTLSYDKSATPFAGAPVSITTDDPLTAYKKVLSSAGALRLDASAASLRDELDTLLIDSVENQESILVAKDSPREVTQDHPEYAYDPPSNGEYQLASAPYNISNSGFGTLNSATAPTDTDGDGMPDYWENTLGSDPLVQNHNNVFKNNGVIITTPTFFPDNTSAGYTKLEEYLYFCSIPHAIMPENTAAQPSSLTVDVSRYTRGFTSEPRFAITDIKGGTVAQFAADGITPSSTGPIIVFTPTGNYSGRAGYQFNVTDTQGSSWKQPLGIIITPR